MNNFKSGAGNLDFGSGSGDDNDGTQSEETDSDASTDNGTESAESRDRGRSPSDETDRSGESDRSTSATNTETESEPEVGTETESDEDGEDQPEYPYFVRRSNVGDERDDRIEVHLRSVVSDQESSFRNELADCLDTSDVPKTDAREFALKFAFQNPEDVAELMREEGFGVLD